MLTDTEGSTARPHSITLTLPHLLSLKRVAFITDVGGGVSHFKTSGDNLTIGWVIQGAASKDCKNRADNEYTCHFTRGTTLQKAYFDRWVLLQTTLHRSGMF